MQQESKIMGYPQTSFWLFLKREGGELNGKVYTGFQLRYNFKIFEENIAKTKHLLNLGDLVA